MCITYNASLVGSDPVWTGELMDKLRASVVTLSPELLSEADIRSLLPYLKALPAHRKKLKGQILL